MNRKFKSSNGVRINIISYWNSTWMNQIFNILLMGEPTHASTSNRSSHTIREKYKMSQKGIGPTKSEIDKSIKGK